MLLPRKFLRPSQLPTLLHYYTFRVFLVFLIPYTLAILYARLQCRRDPTSFFFRENDAYDPVYSTLRAQQGLEMIKNANRNGSAMPPPKASPHPSLCVGFASVARSGVDYFQSAVGSVLEGLSPEERADMYLILFIAHTNASDHPAYSQPWLHALSDRVLLYDERTVDIDHIRSLETAEEKSFAREKGLFDYSYLLKACQAVNTPYTVMFEDDVIALDGWYHRTKQALVTADEMASKWLYLRLFYTEKFLGWNSEEWPIYLLFSVLTTAAVAVTVLATRHYAPSSRPFLQNEIVLLICFGFTPLFILLFFAAGKITMLPLPEGVNLMSNFGCCSQGFVFPQSRVKDLLDWYQSKHVGYVDMLTEEFADKYGEVRLALTPSVLQHVGSKSSKTGEPIKGKDHQTLADTLWNFSFEEHDAGVLRGLHDSDIAS